MIEPSLTIINHNPLITINHLWIEPTHHFSRQVRVTLTRLKAVLKTAAERSNSGGFGLGEGEFLAYAINAVWWFGT